MMNINEGNSSSEWALDDLNFDFDGLLDIWIDGLMDDNCELVLSSGVETMTINPGPSQPIMSTFNNNTNSKGSSANQSPFGIANEMTSMSSLIPNNSTPSPYIPGQALSAEPIHVSNSAAQNSQSGTTTDFSRYHPIQSSQQHQNSPQLKHVFNNNPAQQPLTHALADQSNFSFSDQKNKLHCQMLSNQLAPCTRPMLNAQAGTLQNSQASILQTQQNPNQQQLQLQHGTGTSGNLLSDRRQQETNTNMNFKGKHLQAPAGIITPPELSPPDAWREYALAQIKLLREKHFSNLLKMYNKATQFRNQATNVDASKEYQRVITFLEKMLSFLSISTDDSLPINNRKTYSYMTQIAKYVKNHMSKSGASSQHREPGRHPSTTQHVDPNRGRKLIDNPPPNPSTGVANLDNIANFNQNFPSRRPQNGRMPSVQSNRSSQIGIDQKPVSNPQRISSFKAPQPIVLSTSQQVNLGSKNSSANVSGFPIDLLSNTTASNFPSRPLTNQPAVANQKLNLEKMKQPMHKTHELNESKGGQAMSPLGSKLLNQGHSQFPHPSTQKPISQQTASPQWSSWLSAVTSSGFDVNHVLSPESISRSPFILSFSPNTSGQSSLSTAESRVLKKPMDPPCREQGREEEKLKDPIQRLVDVVKSMPSKAMGSSLTEISSLRREMDIVPNIEPPNVLGSYINDEENAMLENDNEPERKIRRKLSVSSVSQDQLFDFEEWPVVENKETVMAEIKQINSKLLETSMVVVSDSAQGTIVHCIFRNVCFRDLLGPQAGVSSEKMPEFVIQLLVPVSYPAFAPKICNLRSNVLSEPWGKLYEEMVTRFHLALRGVGGQMLLGDMAQKWDASVRSVMTEFVQKMGGQCFGSQYGRWESCIHSSSGSN